VRENEPTLADTGPEGSLGLPRLCAMRSFETLGPQPWMSNDFMQPPHAASDDVWIQVDGGWVVCIHRSLRRRMFHPLHRSCPVRIGDLEPRRTTVICWSGPRGWERAVQHDEWGTGNVMVQGQWRGWTFFRLSETNQLLSDEGSLQWLNMFRQ